MSDDEKNEREIDLDLSSPDVVTKYKTAAEIINSMFSFFIIIAVFLMRNSRAHLIFYFNITSSPLRVVYVCDFLRSILHPRK